MLTVPNDKLGSCNIQLANKLRKSLLRAASEVLLSLLLILHENKSEFCAFCTWGHIGTVSFSAWTAETVDVLHY